MAIGAHDYIDQLLVQKYATEKVDNHEGVESMIRPEEVMKAMNDYASVSRNMVALSQKLSSACRAINAVSAQYKRAAILDAQ
jgi:hypothetical protein